MYLVVLLTAEGAPAANGRGDGYGFSPPNDPGDWNAECCCCGSLSSWMSVARRERGSRSGCQMSQMRSSSSSASFVEEILVKKLA